VEGSAGCVLRAICGALVPGGAPADRLVARLRVADKEFQQVVRAAEIGRRYVDKLVKVWTKEGVECWVLIHVEVQTTRDAEFPRRMYVYNFHVFDRYNRPVASLAVLADDEPDWRPMDCHSKRDRGRREGRWRNVVISVVIPVCSERDSLQTLYAEIAGVARSAQLDLEILLVDDGSTDGSWPIIAELAREHAEVHGIRFRRNFGKAAALSAGFRAACGDILLTLDADLQDDPAEIPRFLAALGGDNKAKGTLDVVSGWKRVRHDPWHKVWPSRIFNLMVSWTTGVHLHDHNCGMKCYRAEVFREVRLYGELHRFIPVLAAARGFRVGELEITHRPRRFGHSKYGVRRFVKGFLDLLTVKFLTGFGQRPQHLLGSLGLVSFLLGNLGLLYLAVTWVIRLWYPEKYDPLHQRPLLIYALAALLLGAQMMSIGFLAELVTANMGRDEDRYSIAETTPSTPTADHRA
jgi:dolichol-phosphate mannosyltransferase